MKFSFLSSVLTVIYAVVEKASEFKLFVLALIIAYDVVLRYVFNSPTIWVLEISEYMLVFLTFLSAAKIQKEKAHIKMDFFYLKFPPKFRVFVDLVFYVLIVLFSYVLLYNAVKMTITAYKYESMSNSLLEVPLYIPYAIIPVGMILLMLQGIIDTVNAVKKIITWDHPNESLTGKKLI